MKLYSVFFDSLKQIIISSFSTFFYNIYFLTTHTTDKNYNFSGLKNVFIVMIFVILEKIEMYTTNV